MRPKTAELWDVYHATARAPGGEIVHYHGICEAGTLKGRVRAGWPFFRDLGARLLGTPTLVLPSVVLARALRAEHENTLAGIEQFGLDAVRGAWIAMPYIAPSLKRELARVQSQSPCLGEPDDLDWASFPKLRCHLSSLCFKCRELWLPRTAHVCGAVAAAEMRERERAEEDAKRQAAKERAAAAKERERLRAEEDRKALEKAVTAKSKACIKANKKAARAKPTGRVKTKAQPTIDKETQARMKRKKEQKERERERMRNVHARGQGREKRAERAPGRRK